MALFVLQKYYRLSQAIPACAAAVLLDPSKRKSYMTGTWDLPEMRRVIDQVQQIWEAKYKDLSVPDESRSQDSQNWTQRKKGKQKKNDNIESIFDGICNELAGLKLGAEDDFLPFVGAPPVELHNLTPVQWWGLDGQRSQYPRLHRMALDILCSTNVRCAGENIFRWKKDNFMDKGKAQAQKS